MVSIKHGQNICSKTTYLLAVICRSRGALSANEKKGEMHQMIIIILLLSLLTVVIEGTVNTGTSITHWTCVKNQTSGMLTILLLIILQMCSRN